MYCEKCNEKKAECKLMKKTEIIKVKGENFKVQSTVACCSVCGTEMCNEEFDDETLIIAYNKYRKKHRLLMPNEIETIRKKYGATQSAFAKILGFGEKTITRYENGSLQDEAQNNLILLCKEKQNFKILYDKNMTKLTDKEREPIEKAITKTN